MPCHAILSKWVVHKFVYSKSHTYVWVSFHATLCTLYTESCHVTLYSVNESSTNLYMVWHGMRRVHMRVVRALLTYLVWRAYSVTWNDSFHVTLYLWYVHAFIVCIGRFSKRNLRIWKRDLHIWKETYIYEKRPVYKHSIYTSRDLQIWKRDLHIWKETYIYEKRPVYKHSIYTSRDLQIWKETYIYEKRPTYMKRDLHIWKETYIYEKKPTYMKRDLHIWKEAGI